MAERHAEITEDEMKYLTLLAVALTPIPRDLWTPIIAAGGGVVLGLVGGILLSHWMHP